MPSGMPTDAYLSTFETNSHAARALFWARTGNWRFADWRNQDLDKLSEVDEASLGHAIEQEALVTDADLERMLAGYHSLMDPRVPVHYCGACGTTDVPISGTSAPAGAAERMHIESFSRFLFTDPILVPLRYTPDQNALFESGPGHVNMTLAGNRELWLRYRRAISAVDVSTDGTASAPLLCRLHLYPDLVSDGSTEVCSTCLKALRQRAIPEFSVAGRPNRVRSVRFRPPRRTGELG